MAEGLSDNLYISGLPLGMDDSYARAIFTPYGTVVSTRILPSRPGSVDCHALVRFASVDEAAWIVQNLNGNIPQGLTEKIGAKFAANRPGGGSGGGGGAYGSMADPSATARFSPYGATKEEAPPCDNLYITNLPMGIDQEMMMKLFAPFGQVVQCKVLEKEGQTKCCALVRFESEMMATSVRDACNGQIIPGLSEPVVINYAARSGGSGSSGGASLGGSVSSATAAAAAAAAAMGYGGGLGGGMGAGLGGGLGGGMDMLSQKAMVQDLDGSGVPDGFGIEVIVKGLEDSNALPGAQSKGTCIYIAGLPGDTNIGHVYKLFASFGAITPKGVAVRRGPANKWAISFVTFIEQESAELAIQTYNGMVLPDGGTMKVTLRG